MRKLPDIILSEAKNLSVDQPIIETCRQADSSSRLRRFSE
jgi:hypothetical protein